MDDDGDFVVLWESYVKNSGTDVKGQRYSSAGLRLGSEFRSNQETSDYQGYTSVAMNAGGAFLVTWTSYGQDDSVQGVFARRYSSSGTALDHEFQVTVVTGSDQSYPTVDRRAGRRLRGGLAEQRSGRRRLRRLRAPVRELRRGDRWRVPGQLVHDDGPVLPLDVDGLERRLRGGVAKLAPGRVGLRRVRAALHQHRATGGGRVSGEWRDLAQPGLPGGGHARQR